MTRSPLSILFGALLFGGVFATPIVDAFIDSESSTVVTMDCGPTLGDLTATSVRIACRRAEPGEIVIGLADA
ncbi:MAG: hypothetical protein P8I44_05505, partial [Phycisphaerales bacterium]|nr:hypothetical protein [Phycisphaerales bacterium]